MKQILTPRGWRPINESVDNRFIAKPRNKKDHAKQSNWHHGEAQRLEDQAAHFDKADHYGDNIVKRNYENLSAELRRQAAFHRKQADHHERQMSGKLLEDSEINELADKDDSVDHEALSQKYAKEADDHWAANRATQGKRASQLSHWHYLKSKGKNPAPLGFTKP